MNDTHVDAVARATAEAGASLFNAVPLHPVAGTDFEHLPEPDKLTMSRVRHQAETYLPQMTHCQRCRADAVGLLGEEHDEVSLAALAAAVDERAPAASAEARPHVAVASMEGMLVNQHLGEAERLLVFKQGAGAGEFELVETRIAPPPGGGVHRWKKLAEQLHDCRALLCLAAGSMPRAAMDVEGIQVVEMNGLIDEGLDAVYAGRKPLSLVARKVACHGGGCGGANAGLGC